MPRQAKPLPDYIEVSDDQKKVRCLLCHPTAASRQWLNRESLTNHLKTSNHRKAVQALKSSQNDQEQEASQIAAQDIMDELEFAFLAEPPHKQAPTRASGATTASTSALEQELWDALQGDDIQYEIAPTTADQEALQRQRMDRAEEMFGLWDASHAAFDLGFQAGMASSSANASGSENEAGTLLDEASAKDILLEDAELADVLSNMTAFEDAPLENITAAVDINGSKLGVDPASPWFPYPSRTMFLLTILDGLPRLRISDSLLRIFLWILREAGVKDVPSFDRFRKTQREVQRNCGPTTIQCKSPKGNVFYINDPRHIIAKDWANPMVRPELRVYPEIPADGVIREIWHAEKWHKGMPLSSLSPMYDADDKHFYVNEWAQLADGRYILPQRWVTYQGQVHADVHILTFTGDSVRNTGLVDTSCTALINAGNLRLNFHDLKTKQALPNCSWPADEDAPPMPNPLRELAGDEPLYTSFIDHFGDDVSGNRSKSWNKHWNTYITHRNLP
ncbi:hypothetical protein NUW54_g8659 [Trametes sanguinea]|uniref:Uncharacterized protein n=1 Tax=Trametes sanguinea TaxID=158606 RepID=A0ACC1PCB3_9APHY|nr:hypothetical protein NUW54_g8659 [Trametes sanguinea]